MVAIICGVTSSYLASNSGLATSASVTGASLGTAIGVKHAIEGVALKTLKAASAGGGAVAGAIIGPIVAGTIGEGHRTLLTSAISSAAGAVSGAAASAAMATVSPPLGGAILGVSDDKGVYNFDCWKPVLRDESKTPSKGLLLRDVLEDPRIRTVEVKEECLVLSNIWDEKFEIYFLELPWGQLGAHAVKI